MNYDDEMIAQLADTIRGPALKTGSQGMRISYEWLLVLLDGDELLTRRVLRQAGFSAPTSTDWAYGRGERRLGGVCDPCRIADNLTDILDLFDRDAA